MLLIYVPKIIQPKILIYLLFADGAPLHHRFFRAFPRVCVFLWKISAHIGRCLPIVPYLCASTSRSGGTTLDKFFIKTLLTSLSSHESLANFHTTKVMQRKECLCSGLYLHRLCLYWVKIWCMCIHTGVGFSTLLIQ